MERPEKIIAAFDECLAYIYGSSFGRDNPHKSDRDTATKWISDGLTVVLAAMVFHDRMTYMHERFLHNKDKSDRSLVPHSLNLFDENIEAALRRQTGDGIVDTWECELSRWRARCKGWLKKPELWRSEMWGPAPFTNGCRVPHSILKETRKASDPDADYEKLRTRALDKRFQHLMDSR